MSLLLSAAMVVPMATTTVRAGQSDIELKIPQSPSFTEINQYLLDHPYDLSLPDEYEIIPDIANEELNERIGDNVYALYGNDEQKRADRDKLAGKLTQETLDNALNATNFMRFHAGLREMRIDTDDPIGGAQWRAQAGAALLAELAVTTHNVDGNDALAAGIRKGVFDWAKAGPGGSNLVGGYGIATKMVNSFMPDIGNDRTGLSHRSYILYPGLINTGFGAANLSGTTNYKTGKARGAAVTMFVTSMGGDPDNYSAVIWPSQRQPIETFQARGTWQMSYPEGNPYQGNPWSFFLNRTDLSVDTSTLKVTLTCDGKPTDVLDFNQIPQAEKGTNRIFTINSFPLKRLIGWRPHVAYGVGDKVHVSIEGVIDQQGLPIPVAYDVHFFKTGTDPYPNLTDITANRSDMSAADISFTSDYDGSMRYMISDTEPSIEQVLTGSELNLAAGSNKIEISDLANKEAKTLYYVTASDTAGENARDNGEMSEIKQIQIPSYDRTDPFMIEPTARTMTYNGMEQVLIYAGASPDGQMLYRLDDGEYGPNLPTATDAGEYTVWYKIAGDASHADVTEQNLSVTIQKAPITVTGTNFTIKVNDPLPDLTASQPYTVSGLIGSDTLSGTPTFYYEREGQPVITPDTTKPGAYEIGILNLAAPSGNYLEPVIYQGTLTILTKEEQPTPPPPDKEPDSGSGNKPENKPQPPKEDRPGGGGGSRPFKPSKRDDKPTTPTPSKKDEIPPISKPAPIIFRDVSPTDYFHDAVQWAAENGITGGTDKDTFSPAASCTRAQMAAFLWRAAGCPEPENKKHSFSDLAPDAYYYKAVLWAVEKGITLGTGEGAFSPQDTITRAQTVTFLYRYAGSPIVDGTNQFRDVPDGAFYGDAVRWAVEQGITSGTGEGKFSPASDCTRAQIVTFLYRSLK